MGLGTAGILCYWALQEYAVLAVDHCRDTVLLLGTARIFCGWALQEYCAIIGPCGILGDWALQGYLVVGHCRDIW